MTKEQWIVYLYDIYPSGGFTALWTLLLITTITIIILSGGSYYLDKYKKGDHYDKFDENEYIWSRFSKKFKISIVLIPFILILLSNLIPSKHGFIAILATPYIVNKVNHINDINTSKFQQVFNLTIDKAIYQLKQDINK